jgi:deoxycytidylate deaminase
VSTLANIEQGPELFFGLIGAVGTDLDSLTRVLKDALLSVRYDHKVIRLSDLLHELDLPNVDVLRDAPTEYDRIDKHMDAGNMLRKLAQSGSALTVAALSAVKQARQAGAGGAVKPIQRLAYIFRSLKHPDEVRKLREIYGANFYAIAAYAPRQERLQALASRLAHSCHARPAEFLEKAQHLMWRDESEGVEFGQNVRETFPEADVFVDVSDAAALEAAIERFIEIIFGYPFHTPTRDEYAIFLAQAAARRSAALARQVGAAITTREGDVTAVGSNEVPKAGGGQYWSGDVPDQRDFRLGYETSEKMKRMMLGDIFDHLKKHGWLGPAQSARAVDALVAEALDGFMADSRLMDVIEFARPMHAEMAALLDAARRGTRTVDHILYTTTFPCHDCARHIVAAGIACVYYIHPYPKSHASELYIDSFRVDEPADQTQVSCRSFIGVAPRRYMDFFEITRRRAEDGMTVVEWDRTRALPRFGSSDYESYFLRENDEVAWLSEALTGKKGNRDS